MSSSTKDVTQSSSPVSQSTSVENGSNMPQLSYENLKRLANEKLWPAVDVVVAKYQENPSQTLLLATLSLLAFISLSVFVAILFLVATLAATLLMLALQITLVCSSIFIAACISVLSLSTLSTPGIARVIEELNHARELAARYFSKSSASVEEPAQSSVDAGSSSPHNAPQPQRKMRGDVVPILLRPKVVMVIIAFTIAAPPIIFLLRHVIASLLVLLFDVIVKFIIRATDNLFVAATLVGYIGYRLEFPSKSKTAEHTLHNTSTSSTTQNVTTAPAPARMASPPPAIPSNTQNATTTPALARTASPPPVIDFAQLNQYRTDAIEFIKPIWKLFVAGLLGGLLHAHYGLMWLINQMAEDGGRAPADRRNQQSKTMDAKKSDGDESEGYEMLPTGSGSALEPRSSLTERKGKAKISSEEE